MGCSEKTVSRRKKRWRLVIDYRKLNEKTIPDPYLLTNITEIFDQLRKIKFYHVIDFKSGFHQIPMNQSDIHKTAFSINPLGRFEFRILPFGLRNSPRIFQRVLNTVLGELIGKICFLFIDDIISFGETVAEANERFNAVAQKLRKANLTLEPQKCEFRKREVCYLGHIISDHGIKPDPKKVEAVKKFPTRTNIKSIREFLGLSGYYRGFIKNHAKVPKPLNILLEKDVKFHWGKEQQKTVKEIKELLCTAPVLEYPRFDKPFIITTDASNFALGAVLSQGEIGKDPAIAYASRSLHKAETSYHTYEKEALAIMFAIITFKNYVYGNKFTIVTDHKSLLWLKSADNNIRVQKWRLKLSDYEFDIVYKPGKQNANADALSRNPIEIFTNKE